MFVRSIALTATLGLHSARTANAGGCYPAFSSGDSYTVDDYVSKTVSETTPVTKTTCTSGTSGCSNGFKTEGGKTVSVKYNFKCNSGYNCGRTGFEPNSIHGVSVWEKESSSCSVSLHSIVSWVTDQPYLL